jgi:hypothetical protein
MVVKLIEEATAVERAADEASALQVEQAAR